MRAFCPTWSEEQLRLRAQWLHTCDERAIVTSFEAFQTDDIHADLSRVCGADAAADRRARRRGPPGRRRGMRTLLPRTARVRVAGAGHMIPWDNEPGFYRAFGDFLGQPTWHRSVDLH